MYAIKYPLNLGPAFRMREKDFMTIIEACCLLNMSLKKFKKYRDELRIEPVSLKKPYEFQRYHIENIMVKSITNQLLGLEYKTELLAPLQLEDWYRHHLYECSLRYAYVSPIRLALIFAKAVLQYDTVTSKAA